MTDIALESSRPCRARCPSDADHDHDHDHGYMVPDMVPDMVPGGSYAGRKLVVIVSMHRSGSSLTASLFQRLGMSLGPFELIGANESNKHGHFEAVPFHVLDRELQALTVGFPDDVPESQDTLRQFCEAEGCRPRPGVPGAQHGARLGAPIPAEAYDRGCAMVRELVESAPISGFKDPRSLLLWPFWQDVFGRFTGLEVIPLFLSRSPHEIAMSIFTRGKGRLAYEDALDVTGAYFQRMLEVHERWAGPQAVIRFDPRVFTFDLRRAAEICGLAWSDAVFAEVYDPSCHHHEPAAVAHPAQEAFDRLAGGLSRLPEEANLRCLANDAAKRQTLMRTFLHEQRDRIDELCHENQRQQHVLDERERELSCLAGLRDETQRTREVIECLRKENGHYVQVLQQCGDEIQRLAAQNQQYDKALEELKQFVRQCYAEKQQADTALSQSRSEIERVSAENRMKERELAERNEQIAELEQRNGEEAEAWRQTEGRLRDQIAGLVAELRSIKRSPLWRFQEIVTTPFRRPRVRGARA